MSLNVNLLEQSFEVIKRREVEFSTQFYTNLLSDYPNVRPLFANTNLEDQSKKLFASLVLVIDNLQKPEVLSSTLKGLGTRHVKYGVLPQHYPMVGGALLKTFAQILKTDWTPDVETAWKEAYKAVAQIMLDGADYSPESLKLSS
jgi:hemoglobin-like flavoprotein